MRINWDTMKYYSYPRCVVALLSAMLLMLCSCAEDPVDIPSRESARVILNIRTPKNSAAGQNGRDAVARGETSVQEVDILVFHDSRRSGNYTYAYMVRGSRISQQPDLTTRFEANLRTADVPVKLLILANSGQTLQSYVPGVGEDEQSVRGGLELEFPQGGMEECLPMYGEISLPNIEAGVTNVMNVSVLRAVARVDVKTRLAPGSPSFDIREVRIYRANDRLRLIPDNLAGEGELKVLTPTVPASAASLAQPLVKASPAPTDSIGGIYLPESRGFSESEQRRTRATAIVVGGVFEGDTVVTYYRVDFNSGVEGHPFGQVLRNYLYSFTVKRVSASGWPTPEEALSNMAASMTVDVQAWEDFTSDIYFHEDYIGVSTRKVQVPFLPNYSRTVYVESSMHYSIEWLGETEPGGSVSQYGVPLTNGRFTATILHDSSQEDKLTRILIESPGYNTTDDEYGATLRLSVNDTAVDIDVIKESPSRYSKRIFQVTSMGTTYGSLGDYALTVPETRAMRKVLDVNFSPNSAYPFKIGGFSFLTVPISTTKYSASTAAADIAQYKKMIANTDILILSYTNYTSVQVARMLFDEWLAEKPNRVLWVMLDAPASNAGVRTIFQQEGMGTWRDMAGIFQPASGYRAAADSDFAYSNAREVEQFFSGPFGTVAPDSPLFFADVIAGLVQIPDSAKRKITPLVYNNYAPYRDYMVMGVETRRGVVYQGESQLFQGGVGMSSGMGGDSAEGNGTIVGTPQTSGATERYYLDVLNANIWAWAVGRVIYGPPTD